MEPNAIVAFINVLEEVSQLEAAGKELTANQFLQIIDAVADHTLSEKKLQPLLVGMPPDVFEEVLNLTNHSQLDYLKLEGVTEPIQHHLTILANEAGKTNEAVMVELINLEKEIQNLDLTKMNRKDLEDIKKNLADAAEHYRKLLSTISKALAITWNTNRLDLIEKFTQLKERCLGTLYEFIGIPRQQEDPATGLYGDLEQRLFGAFNEADAVKDTDPATEALAVFSIWYLKDYWSVGLLPSIKNERELELETDDEFKKRDHRQKLFSLVQENLILLGIGTFGDLKKAEIFSKTLLEDYITTHRSTIK